MTTDKVKEIVDDVFAVYYSEYMGQGEYGEDEAQEALDTALNALDEVEKYKKAIEEFKTRIDYECGSKGQDDYDYCSGLIRAKRILEVQLKGVSECSEEKKK